MERLTPARINMETGVPDNGWFEVPVEVYPPVEVAARQPQESPSEAQPETVEAAA